MGASFAPPVLQVAGTGGGPAGRRSAAARDHGAHVADMPPDGRVRDLAIGATLRAAAPWQRARGRSGPGLVLRRDDLREKGRAGREGNLVLFVVDASGSMAARRRMTAVKGAAVSLLLDAYQRRDRVGLITFRGERADVALPPTGSVDRAAALLAELPTGGRTPLAAGLERAAHLLAGERVRDPRRRPLLVLLTDGRATAAADGREPVGAALAAARGLAAQRIPAIVIDTEDAAVRLGLAARVAQALRAPCVQLDELASDSLTRVVRTATDGRRAA